MLSHGFYCQKLYPTLLPSNPSSNFLIDIKARKGMTGGQLSPKNMFLTIQDTWIKLLVQHNTMQHRSFSGICQFLLPYEIILNHDVMSKFQKKSVHRWQFIYIINMMFFIWKEHSELQLLNANLGNQFIQKISQSPKTNTFIDKISFPCQNVDICYYGVHA